MFAGHFGLAAAVKAKSPEVPLWALMIGTQLLDVIFVPLFLSGAETIEPINGEGYGEMVIHADYTHSLAGALIIALLAGWIAKRLWGKRGGIVISSVVFSHWLLDLLVHRADMPILPGNLGKLPLLGFQLWQYPGVSMGLEMLLIVAGIIMYTRSIIEETDLENKRWALASGVMGISLILSLITDVAGIG